MQGKEDPLSVQVRTNPGLSCQYGSDMNREKKSYPNRKYPTGYAEMLEKQHLPLTLALEELYRLSLKAGLWSKPILKETDGHPLTQDLLSALNLDKGDGSCRQQNDYFRGISPSHHSVSLTVNEDIQSGNTSPTSAHCGEGHSKVIAGTDSSSLPSCRHRWIANGEVESMTDIASLSLPRDTAGNSTSNNLVEPWQNLSVVLGNECAEECNATDDALTHTCFDRFSLSGSELAYEDPGGCFMRQTLDFE